MKKSTNIWLWIALILSSCTTILNATQTRWLSVGIAIIALSGLCVLLFKQKKAGFCILCVCNVLSFLVGVFSGNQGGTNIFLTVLMSFIGSALIPSVTWIFLRDQWENLS